MSIDYREIETEQTEPQIQNSKIGRMETIALFNLKGGVGKTTLTANLGAAFSSFGKKVLLIDIDPQQNLTQNLGVNPMRVDGIEDFLAGKRSFEEVVKSYRGKFDFITAGKGLRDLEISLAANYHKDAKTGDFFRRAFAKVPLDYDYLIIDCPPSVNLLTTNALSFVKRVFVPVQCQHFALHGSKKTVSFVYKIKAFYNPGLSISAIIPVMYDRRNKLSDSIIKRLENMFRDKLTKTKISVNVALAESPGFGKTIFDYKPNSRGAKDIRNLAVEIMEREIRNGKRI